MRIPAKCADATACLKNHVHIVTGGNTMGIANQKKVKTMNKENIANLQSRAITTASEKLIDPFIDIISDLITERDNLVTQVRALEAEVSRLERVATNG
jgi:hypothetical protein